MKEVEEHLRRVRAALTPETWTKGALGRTENNDRCGFAYPRARKWCLLGHVERLTERNKLYVRDAASETLQQAITNYTLSLASCVSEYNDAPDTTFDDIVRLVDRAVEIAANPRAIDVKRFEQRRAAYAVRYAR